MKTTILSIILCLTISAQSQYYYTDIIGPKEISKQQSTYVAQKVKTITATGTDKNGVKARDYSEYHEVRENGNALRIVKITGLQKTTTLHRFDIKGKLISVTDSADDVQNHTIYSYDTNGNVNKIQNKVEGSNGSFNQTETHTWEYDADGSPVRMWRSFDGVNSKDSMEVKFLTDENGNVSEEKTFKRGKETGFIYYYHDDKNQLTDIVRFNTKLKKLMPDVMFEYDDKGNVLQKITTTSSQSMGYLIWRFVYNDKGLKTKEALFNKNKQLTGRIDYKYSFDR